MLLLRRMSAILRQWTAEWPKMGRPSEELKRRLTMRALMALACILGALGSSSPADARPSGGPRPQDLVPASMGIFQLRAVGSWTGGVCYSPELTASYKFDRERGIPESVSDTPGVDWQRGTQVIDHHDGTVSLVQTDDFGFGIILRVGRAIPHKPAKARELGCPPDIKTLGYSYEDARTMRTRRVPPRAVNVRGHEAFVFGLPERSGLDMADAMGLAVWIEWSVPGWSFTVSIGNKALGWLEAEKYALEAATEAAEWIDRVLANRIPQNERKRQAAAMRNALAQGRIETR